VAEDHGLCDSNGSVDVAQSLEFLLLAVADDVVLLDAHCRHLANYERNPVPLDTNALVLMALCGDHDISFIQDEHLDLPGVDEFKLLAPIQNSSGINTKTAELFPCITFTASDALHT
uniref:Uncharacterized protein n=1 Tax=Sinocyclocheilus grahami TaxID=75366 RepID=A0A672NVK7_SINGR